MSFDFLPNMNQRVGGGLNAQLARLGQVQRQQPLVGIAQTQAFITHITKMMQDAQANIVQGMISICLDCSVEWCGDLLSVPIFTENV